MRTFGKNNIGLTLIELMIAMAISILVMASIYQVFRTHQKAQATQQLVVEMQQNARAALTLMKREIRMAGYKPAASDGIDNDGDGSIDDADDDENGRKAGQEIGVITALRDQIMFRMDILPDNPADCNDGVDNDSPADGLIDENDECYDGLPDDANEQITYRLQANAAGDGFDLVRITSTGTDILAYDIEAIAFGYAYDVMTFGGAAGADGSLDTDTNQSDGNIIWAYYDGSGFPVSLNTNAETGVGFMGPIHVPPGGNPVIGAVRIWLLARTAQPIRGEADTRTYQVGDQVFGPPGAGADVTYNPAYRRTLQTATVYCRNLRFKG